ncbi:MAG: reactive intermediate/imine deaminase [Planctomycetes bacterium]|nr:reactive intermediate/imine deaminase [Planctomycetota bacterium]
MNDRRIVSTPGAPKAIGPYSQAVAAGGLVFTAGQIALDPATGSLVGDGHVGLETERVLRNLEAVLTAAGSGLDLVLRCDVFLADLADFGAMNEVYGRFFGSQPPARVTVQAARLPKDARVEIAAVAAVR